LQIQPLIQPDRETASLGWFSGKDSIIKDFSENRRMLPICRKYYNLPVLEGFLE
jgi:hypothetical protein